MPNPMSGRQAIRSRIKTYLADPHPEIDWILREDYQQASPPTGEHVVIDILPARSRLVGTGAPRLFRTRGALVFRIATPMTDGAGRNEEIAETIIAPNFRALLDSSGTPAVRYYTPLWAPSDVPDETMFIGRLAVDFEYDFNEP